MNWDGALQAFVAPATPEESSFGFVYNRDHNHSEGMGFVCPGMSVELPAVKSGQGRSNQENKAKKRLSNQQLEILEESFSEGIKLDPDRKMKLSRELGIEPRQVAVWFQNRRTRWKAKQMEVLYTELRQEFDVTCKEKLKLQEEALRLKSILRFRAAGKKQLVVGIREEETVRSSCLMPIHSPVNEAGFNGWYDMDTSAGIFGSD